MHRKFDAREGASRQVLCAATSEAVVVRGEAGEKSLQIHSSTQIGSPTNGWNGGNRGGWSNPEFDRLFDRFNATLDRGERDKLVVDMVKVYSDQLPAYYTYFQVGVLAYLADLRGPAAGNVDRLAYWNVHEWQFD